MAAATSSTRPNRPSGYLGSIWARQAASAMRPAVSGVAIWPRPPPVTRAPRAPPPGRPRARRLVGEAAGGPEGLAAGAFDGRRRLVGRRRRAIDARHARALGGEADRRRASDPRAGTGDQRERPTHPSHWHHPEIHARNRRLDPAGSRIQSLVPGTPGGRGEASP